MNKQLETDFLRELLCWNSPVNGLDVIRDHSLLRPDLCTGLWGAVWELLLKEYADSGVFDPGIAVTFFQGEDRSHITKLITDGSSFLHFDSVPFAKWHGELTRLAISRKLAATGGLYAALRLPGADPVGVAYELCSKAEEVILEGLAPSGDGDYDEYKRLLCGGGTWRTGIGQLDRHGRLGGWYSILAARSHHGKTAAMCSMVLNQLLAGHSVFMWQGEQTAAQFRFRMVCQMTGLRPREVLEPEAEWMASSVAAAERQVREWLDQGSDPCLFLSEGTQTVPQILRTIRAAQTRTHIHMAYIDQLSRIRRNDNVSREAAYSEISETLAEAAKRMKQPILMAAQLNVKTRMEGASTPAYWQIKDCGRLFEDCALWITLDRPEADPERLKAFDAERDKTKDENDADFFDVRGRIKLKIEKDRLGLIGKQEEWCAFVSKCGRVESRLCADWDLLTKWRPREDEQQPDLVQEDMF